MKRPVLWCSLAVCAACGSDSSQSTGLLTPPTSASNLTVISAGAASQHQQETWAAVSGNRIVAVWIGYDAPGAFDIEYAISDDDGVSWANPAAVPIPAPLTNMGDPIITTDAAGNFELVALGESSKIAEVVAFRLAAGSTTFDAASIVDSVTFGRETFDKPQIVKTSAGYLVTYSRLRTDQSGAGVGGAATSTDGISWRHDTLATNAPIFIAPCADGNAATATYLNLVATGLWATSSSDGGATWTAPSQVESTAQAGQPPGCARRGNDVWLVYGSASSVGLYHSTDAGATFASAGTVQDANAFYGQIGLKSDGTLELAYYSATKDVPFGLAHRFVARGSQSMGGYLMIQTNLQSNFTTNRFAQNGYADYIGVIPAGIVYTDNSTGTSHIAFYRESTQ